MAITIEGVVFRNLQEQVKKNKDDINDIQLVDTTINGFGIHVLGHYSTAAELPESAVNYGDAYMVGLTTPYNYYIWTNDTTEGTDSFVNIGVFPAVGPQGIQGIQGIQGEKGETGSRGLKGETGSTGLTGATGATGPQGPIGNTGPQGIQGERGIGVNILGTLSSTGQLPTPTSVAKDSAFLIPDNDVNYMWVIEGTSDTSTWTWVNFGPSGITGPTGPQGAAGIGITDVTDLSLTAGNITVTYNSTTGATIDSSAQYSYNTDDVHNFDSSYTMPIIAGTGMSIDANASSNAIVVDCTGLASKQDTLQTITLFDSDITLATSVSIVGTFTIPSAGTWIIEVPRVALNVTSDTHVQYIYIAPQSVTSSTYAALEQNAFKYTTSTNYSVYSRSQATTESASTTYNIWMKGNAAGTLTGFKVLATKIA